LLVNLFPGGVVDAGADINVCYGNTVTIQGSGSISYVWNNNIIDGQTFLPTVGIDTNIVIGTNINGCLAQDTMVLTVWSNPGITAGPDQMICEGDSTFVSGNGAITYVWNNGGIINQDYFIPSANGLYTLVGTDVNGCIGYDTLQIMIEPAAYPNFYAPITSSCHPFTVQLINTSTGTQAESTVWDFGDGNQSVSPGNSSHTYSYSDCFDVSLTLTTQLGCVWDTMIPQYLCDYPNPVADFTPSPVELTNLDNVSEMINESIGATNYYWDFGYENATSTEFSPEHIFPSYPSATYLITLVAETEFGCIDSVSNTVNLTENQIFYVPNTFTPDEDEHNQVWLPIITSNFDPYNYSCIIYNRWGEIIWESRDPYFGWDGSFEVDGRDVQNGIYTWVISLKTPQKDEVKKFTGHVTLIR
jgi:gliding motility-associated-like protein